YALSAAGAHRAVVSASANTQTIVECAKLAELIERCVDGNTIVAEQLRGKPAPDSLLAAVFEPSPAGAAPGRAGGFALVVGVDPIGEANALRAGGADIVVASLAQLLERNPAA